VFVEFFGLPGSGKSTMSRLVADTLRDRGHKVNEVTYDIDHRRSRTVSQLVKLAHLAPYVARHPRRALADIARIAATRQARRVDLAKSIFNWTFISSLAARKRSAVDVSLLDQGVAQALWSVGFAARRETWRDLLDAQAPAMRPNVVIHVRADPQVIGERLARRERHLSRMDARGRDRQALERAAQQAGSILASLRSAGVAVVEVENNDGEQLVSGVHHAADAIILMLREPEAVAGARPGEDRQLASASAGPDQGGWRDEECKP
jgi:thymidylate kinase